MFDLFLLVLIDFGSSFFLFYKFLLMYHNEFQGFGAERRSPRAWSRYDCALEPAIVTWPDGFTPVLEKPFPSLSHVTNGVATPNAF